MHKSVRVVMSSEIVADVGIIAALKNLYQIGNVSPRAALVGDKAGAFPRAPFVFSVQLPIVFFQAVLVFFIRWKVAKSFAERVVNAVRETAAFARLVLRAEIDRPVNQIPILKKHRSYSFIIAAECQEIFTAQTYSAESGVLIGSYFPVE